MRHQVAFPARQSGFALVAAIFLLVIVAALGAFAVRTTVSQQSATDLQLLSARAQAAAESGIDAAAARLQAVGNCAGLSAPFPTPDGFTVSYALCAAAAPVVVGAGTVTTFTVRVTAASGTYGAPDFVSRTITARIAI
jgi:MSHA biogenesis protein MshP